MKYKKFICITLSLLLLSGCQAKAKIKVEEKGEKSAKVQIGMSLDSKMLERWIRDVDVFVSTAGKMGAEVDVQSANGSVAEQIKQIDYFVEKKKDVIVIVAVDCKQLAKAVNNASEKGIKIISYDRLIQNAKSDLYISFDNVIIGELMANEIINGLTKGSKVLIIAGPKSDQNAVVIEETVIKKLKEEGFVIVDVHNAKGWMPEYAYQAVNTSFQKTEDIGGIVCGNDGLAVWAIKALAEQRRAGSVLVVGQDADVEACQKIVEGSQRMTVYKAVESLAKEAAEYAVMLGQGMPIDGITDTVTTGNYKVKAKLLTPVPVTKENMDEIVIESGFHIREDVYLNVE